MRLPAYPVPLAAQRSLRQTDRAGDDIAGLRVMAEEPGERGVVLVIGEQFIAQGDNGGSSINSNRHRKPIYTLQTYISSGGVGMENSCPKGREALSSGFISGRGRHPALGEIGSGCTVTLSPVRMRMCSCASCRRYARGDDVAVIQLGRENNVLGRVSMMVPSISMCSSSPMP